jgi:hypothetical protein
VSDVKGNETGYQVVVIDRYSKAMSTLHIAGQFPAVLVDTSPPLLVVVVDTQIHPSNDLAESVVASSSP